MVWETLVITKRYLPNPLSCYVYPCDIDYRLFYIELYYFKSEKHHYLVLMMLIYTFISLDLVQLVSQQQPTAEKQQNYIWFWQKWKIWCNLYNLRWRWYEFESICISNSGTNNIHLYASMIYKNGHDMILNKEYTYAVDEEVAISLYQTSWFKRE